MASELLHKLDDLLAASPPAPSPGRVDDDEYSEQHEEFRKVTNQRAVIGNYLATRICKMLRTAEAPSIRICSVGCGDGQLDKLVLLKVLEKHPQANIEVLGVDINDLSCQKAKEHLGQVSRQHAQVKFKVVSGDILDVSAAEEGAFDAVLVVHTLYYIKDIEGVLRKLLELQKQSGETIIVNATRDPLNELFPRFSQFESNHTVTYEQELAAALKQLGIVYSTEKIIGQLNLTQCFKDGFQKPDQKRVLDFIAQTRFCNYPTAVAQVCIQYLEAICNEQGKPDEHIIDHIAFAFLLQREQAS